MVSDISRNDITEVDFADHLEQHCADWSRDKLLERYYIMTTQLMRILQEYEESEKESKGLKVKIEALKKEKGDE